MSLGLLDLEAHTDLFVCDYAGVTTYGERLKDLRVAAGFNSIEAAAKAAGIDKETLVDFENDRPRRMQARTRAKFAVLARLYRVPLADVLPTTPTDSSLSGLLPSGDSLRIAPTRDRNGLTSSVRESEAALLRRIGARGLSTLWRFVDLVGRNKKQTGAICGAVDALLDQIEEHGVPRSPKAGRRTGRGA